MLLISLLVQGCKFSFKSQSCFFLRENKEQQIRLNYFFMNEVNLLTVIMIVVGKNEN